MDELRLTRRWLLGGLGAQALCRSALVFPAELSPPPSHPQTAAELAAGVLPVNLAHPPGNILRYGANSSPGTTPMDAAFAAMVAAICPKHPSNGVVGRGYLPAGVYFFAETWNLTNTRAGGTPGLDGLVIEGDGMYATVCRFGCGSGRAMVETTGSQWLKLRQIQLAAAPSNPASVGVYQAVQGAGFNAQTQNQRYESLLVSLHDDPTANGGLGTVGIWNFGAEESTYDSVYVSANVAFLGSGENPPTAFAAHPPASYVQAKLARSHSLGLTTFAGECFLGTTGRRQPAIITEDVNAMKFENTYVSVVGGGAGENATVWSVYGSLNGLDFNGEVEGLPRFFDVFGAVSDARVRVTTGMVTGADVERIKLERGGQGFIANSDFHFNDAAAPARPLFLAIPGAKTERISCYLQNSVFRVNCDKRFTAVQENVLWNPATGNVTIEARHGTGNPYRYLIGSDGTQEVNIPDTPCSDGGHAAGAEVVRLVLPSVAGSGNALAADVHVEGIAVNAASAAGTMGLLPVDAHVTVIVSGAGAVSVSVTTPAAGSPPVTDSTRGALTAVAVSASAAAGGDHVQIVLTPTRSGTGAGTVSFSGTARLRWRGNDARAPSLQTLS